MCLVSYVPIDDGFVISSNRDEAPSRNALELVELPVGHDTLFFPQDIKGGSWIFASKFGKIAVLLNGAFINHTHTPPYKISRGLMLKEFFMYEQSSDFLNSYEFYGVEPFTALLYNKNLVSFRWDGNVKHLEVLDPKEAHIFSSCTLYNPAQAESRKKNFQQMIDDAAALKKINVATIKHIHRDGKIGDPGADFVMNRSNRVKTTSITHVVFKKNQGELVFENLLTKSNSKIRFSKISI